MTADPVTEPMPRDPVDLLIALEEAAGYPIRPECIEGTVVIPPPPDHDHSCGAVELVVQLHMAGWTLAGMGNGYTTQSELPHGQALVIPDLHVQHREPTDLDEAFRKTHKGWHPRWAASCRCPPRTRSSTPHRWSGRAAGPLARGRPRSPAVGQPASQAR
jgi:hypothetical protein